MVSEDISIGAVTGTSTLGRERRLNRRSIPYPIRSLLISQFSKTMSAEKATHITLISRYQHSEKGDPATGSGLCEEKGPGRDAGSRRRHRCHKRCESASLAFPRICQRENEDTSVQWIRMLRDFLWCHPGCYEWKSSSWSSTFANGSLVPAKLNLQDKDRIWFGWPASRGSCAQSMRTNSSIIDDNIEWIVPFIWPQFTTIPNFENYLHCPLFSRKWVKPTHFILLILFVVLANIIITTL